MADRTLTINHADGGSETYTLKTEDVLGVRSMQVDGETVTIDRTAPALIRSIIADGQPITIDTTREGVRTLIVDGTEITIDRTEEYNLPFSAEALNYFSRLDAAGDTTYTPYKQPLANYIDSLVSLGGAYWDDMKSSTSFVGVGIQGITVPLRDGMTVPTNNNFVAGDLDQLTGLKGDGSTKRIDALPNMSGFSQDDVSMSAYQTELLTDQWLMGASNLYLRRASTSSACFALGQAGNLPQLGLSGVSRSSSAGYTYRTNSIDEAKTATSAAITNSALSVLGRLGTQFSNARVATYHAGSALNLATLENLQETLLLEISAI